jgi:thiamine-monophosphate kinase
LDVSDGLIKDAGRICRSHRLDVAIDRVPLSDAALAAITRDDKHWRTVLTGGDDYEVLFTVAPQHVADVIAAATTIGVRVTDLGLLETGGAGVRVCDADGREMTFGSTGYAHF